MSEEKKSPPSEKDPTTQEDPGLTEFKEEALKTSIIEKALARPEANCCTYDKGYISQECFVCLTCFQETKKRAIVCLGCSIKCHEDNHEIISIGFKRHIKCDCGNCNFINNCHLKKKENMDYENIENVYDHNMEGKYCYCDKEEDNESNMAQCFFCEDWFHVHHLNYFGNNFDESDNKKEKEVPELDLVCKNCVKKIKPILVNYDLKKILYGVIPENNEKKEEEVIKLDDSDSSPTKNVSEETLNNNNLLGKKRKNETSLELEIENMKNENNIIIKNEEKKEENISDEDKECKKKIYEGNEELFTDIFLQEQEIFIDCEQFLKMLCRCNICKSNYIKLGLGYLNDKNLYKEWASRKTFDDIINDEKFCEEAAKEISPLESMNNSLGQYLRSKEYLQLPYEQQYIIVQFIAELGNKLNEFIETFDKEHKTFTVEDMYAFIMKYKDYFENLKK